jgi:hypothetical protein
MIVSYSSFARRISKLSPDVLRDAS